MSTKDQISRERILTQLRSLSKNGKAPGKEAFIRETGINEYQIGCHFRNYSAAVEAAGFEPNRFGEEKIPTDTLLRSLAKLTAELKRFPTSSDINFERKRSGSDFPSKKTFENTLGRKDDMVRTLAEWIQDKDEYRNVAEILSGMPSPLVVEKRYGEILSDEVIIDLLSESFLPPVVNCLSEMSRNSVKANEACKSKRLAIGNAFEKRVGIAFRLLGLSVIDLGQGAGREPDGIAMCRKEHWAIIYDAKVRESNYRFGTEDRKFKEYIEKRGKWLQEQGYKKHYFAVVSSGFDQGEVDKARELSRATNAMPCVLLEADALMGLVEQHLKGKLTIDDLERSFANPGILGSRDVIASNQAISKRR